MMANDDFDDAPQRWVDALPGALEHPRRDDHTNDEDIVRGLLEDLRDFYLKPDDWNSPYGPLWAGLERRSKIPEDLTEVELTVLRAVHAQLPNVTLRVRATDVLAFRSSGRERVNLYRDMVALVTEVVRTAPLSAEDTIHQFDRALRVAIRFRGAVGEQGADLVAALIERLRSPKEEFEPIWISDVLLKHRVARDQAAELAAEMRTRSLSAVDGAGRTFRQSAAAWSQFSGASQDATDDTIWVVESLQREARDLLADGKPDSAVRAAAELENALALLRTIPKAERESRGLRDVSEQITAGIAAANARAFGMLRAVRSESFDLSQVRQLAAEAVADVPMFQSVHQFLRLEGVVDYGSIKATAERYLEESPVSRIFSVMHFATDGRVSAHTNRSEDDTVYGVPGNVWRSMMTIYQRRIGLSVNGLILPAWGALTNDHHLQVGHFYSLTSDSPLVPPGRARLTAQALYYGYNGDFLTAAQLLAPQVENIVRVQLANTGVQTRQFKDEKQNEIGLSALMEREDVDDILGADVAFEIRALFCSPLGPNLRNEYAHGLVDDDSQGRSSAIYAWWLVWKLIDWKFSNHMHDVAAAEAREPDVRFGGDASD